ncbi:MAG: cysteine hydrolase, partial [Anaerolineae bacterium]|nr:cysteine hydrolase [Anaerolineae bacterium]
MNTALLIIDIQNDYFPGGKFPLVDPEKAAGKAYELLQCFREHKGHHAHIQHISLKPDAAFFIKGDSGSDIHDSVAHFEGEPIVYKHYPNSFRETDLLKLLQEWKIERVVICGMMTHMCVDATARAAADLGFQVLIAEDACATR